MSGGMTGLQAALVASRAQAPQSSGGEASKPQLARMDQYWTTYLRQLQLGGPQAQSAQPADLAALVAAPPGADLLSALTASKGVADGGASAPSVPKAVRANATSPLDDLAAALRRPAAAGLAPAAGAAAFSLPSAGLWNEAAPAAATAAVSPTATAATVLQNGGDGDGLKRSSGGGGARHGSRGAGTSAAAGTAGGGVKTGRRSAKRPVRDGQPRDSLPLKKRAAATAVSDGGDGEDSAEEGAEVALMRMRADEALADSGAAEDADLRAVVAPPSAGGTPKCSKEKNRQAQRRFRERQKKLIEELRDNVTGLQSDNAAQSKQIFVLQEENRLLKMLLQERNGQLPSSQAPPASAPQQD